MSQNIKESRSGDSNPGMVFGKINYQLMIACIAVLIIGFFLMSGTSDIYSFTKITIAPIVVVSGFALGFIAILKKPKRN